MSARAIPLVDLARFTKGSERDRSEFVSRLGEAFHEIGFVGVVNHGIQKELVTAFYDAANSFFALPSEVKRKYQRKNLAGQRGYTPFGTEHAKQSDVPDLKEFYQLGQDPDPADSDTRDYPANVDVKEVPQFMHLGKELYRAFERSGGALLRAIALHLDLESTYFEDKIHNGTSILRAIHYPPITREPESAIRAEQHEDINLITLLVGASAGGLQVLNKKGEWLSVIPGENEIVINVGDMLQRLTNNYLKSTTHRVVNPPREEWHRPRLSIPFFLHPKAQMDLTCLDSCIGEERPLQYQPVTAGEYLDERLREIGLKK